MKDFEVIFLLSILVILTQTLPKSGSEIISENLWKSFQMKNENNKQKTPKENQSNFYNISKDISIVQSAILGVEFPRLDEQPFDLNEKPPNEEMLRIFRLENLNSDFLRIFQPRESLLFPNGRIQTVPYSLMMKTSDRKWIFDRFLALPYGNNLKPRLNQKKRRLIRQFVTNFNYCPVFYKWIDKGIRFWPPWVKEGHCVNIHGSCSVPSGMFCHEDSHKTVMIFRYICLKRWTKDNCKWYKMHIPILTSCRCSCG
uniref:Noggin 1 n=1 Tax=Schmidtea mediterranea TaxID=79327 RepID=A8SLH4_SCHMD|nr:noggin 1 [Schmidtea mediterranea]